MVDLGDYLGSQTPWGVSSLPWARATRSNVFAARSDLAHAFDWNDGVSDIPYAYRECSCPASPGRWVTSP